MIESKDSPKQDHLQSTGIGTESSGHTPKIMGIILHVVLKTF